MMPSVRAALTVARKEVRSTFQSPVAFLFLAVFQLATVFSFFSLSRFFSRNIADVRPLFAWMPLLLIFLVSAFTMRQWAEERKLGTLEILMTLPVRTVDLVLGKFLAALQLVALALALTFPLPLMISFMGPLDMGPVIGGYLGALLLGSTYVALGLWISSRTDNQVVALMLTLVTGGVLYILGDETLTSLVGNGPGEALRLLGTGSRFESIERGVLDLRDVAYYAGLTVSFLAMNVFSLEMDRIDAQSARGSKRSQQLGITVGLILANALALSAWLTPVTAARIDLTENGDYSISDVTQALLVDLDEPLYIDGFFSERTHPLLSPLVPQIRDLVEEYEVYGRGRVEVSFADPNTDEALEQEVLEQYSIRSVPFQVDDRNQVSVVNSYFHLLVRYGDQYAVLSFDDLIEFQADTNGIDVKLRNLEYDLTRTIKKVTQDFSSVDSLIAGLPETATLTLYATPATLPERYTEVPAMMTAIAEEMAGESGGQFVYAQVDPTGDPALQQRLFDEYGVRPLALDLFGQTTFYLDAVVTMGTRVERIVPQGDVSEADLKTAIEAVLQRLTPGQRTTVGLLTDQPEAPPPNPQIPPQFQPPPPKPDYRLLEQVLGDAYEVQRLEPSQIESEAGVPAEVDVLLVGKPGEMSDKAQWAVDQFLMRGGSVVALAGPVSVGATQQGLEATPLDDDLTALLDAYGVELGEGLVMDSQNVAFPIPVIEERGGLRFQRIELLPYPFFLDVRGTQLAEHPALAGIQSMTMPWARTLDATPSDAVTVTSLVTTSDDAWVKPGTSIEPNFDLYPTDGFAAGAERDTRQVALTLSGRLTSAFAERGNPHLEGEPQPEATPQRSLPDARLTVLGSSESVSDVILQLASQPNGEVHRANLQLVQNLIDWSVEDTDLLSIRTSGAFARTLMPLSDEERNVWETGIYILSFLLLAGVALFSRNRAPLRPLPRKEAA